ncbi:MAG TPA: alpha/beta hydrolase [Ktedonobacterales bacterium]|nr:alpha/beta hydrolase [Ktedonobacterales bacterium]
MNATHVYRSDAGQRAMMRWYDTCLTHLPAPYEALTVPTRHGETHLIARGPDNAPPVLLLHGTEGSALSWRYQLSALATRFRCYALDIIGSAGRSAPTRPTYDGAGYAEWLEDVLNALSLRQAAFVGISNGCWLIWKLAARAPERISRAVLLSANGLVPVRFPFTLARYRAADLLRTHIASRILTPTLIRHTFQRALPPGAVVDDDEAEWFYLLLKHYRFVYPPGVLPDATQALLTAPTLLLMGERDPFFNGRAALAQARRTLANLQHAAIVPGAGHGMILDSPDLVNGRILEFLQAAAAPHSTA